jgi:hypothetical protein
MPFLDERPGFVPVSSPMEMAEGIMAPESVPESAVSGYSAEPCQDVKRVYFFAS